MKHVIRYRLPDGGAVFYSVENGDFGSREEATEFRNSRDAKMVRLGLHEDRGMSLIRTRIVSHLQDGKLETVPA